MNAKQKELTIEERIARLSEFGKAAIEYGDKGWFTHPCKPGSKAPIGKLVPRGLLDASRNPEVLCSWYEQYPDANVAIRTGKELWVLDIDGEEGKASLIELQEEFGELADPSLIVETPGKGFHLYYAYPLVGVVGCRTNIRPGIDVRGDGGCVIAPPSIHPNGGRYEWLT